MKQVLIIKTSSMGDVIHTLPAITDAVKAIPDICFDWVVENSFKEIPYWHSQVRDVIPCKLRQWRRNPMKTLFSDEWRDFKKKLQAVKYDLIIDAQGLTKSAILARLAKGTRCGLDSASARDPFAHFHYQKKHQIPWGQHAVTRIRQLFSEALDYSFEDNVPDYGIDTQRLVSQREGDKYVVFLHGTTWATKHWPENYWMQLAERVLEAGYHIYLPWGNEAEYERANRIALMSPNIQVLPRLNLTELAGVLSGASMMVAVDTGLGHLAAALAVPTISLYGPTDPVLTGAYGQNQMHYSAEFECAPCLKQKCNYRGNKDINPPCFSTVKPEGVWSKMETVLQLEEA